MLKNLHALRLEQLVSFSCVIPYIHDGDDRNSISLVSRTLYELDSITRKHVTVYMHYSPEPCRVSQRFSFIESLTLKGLPFESCSWQGSCGINITTWVKEIDIKFSCLKEVHIRGLYVGFEDVETLARTRGKDLRVLKFSKCYGSWEDGLVHVGKYCNQLITLCLDGYGGSSTDERGAWLHELAMHNTILESLHCKFKFEKYKVEDLTLLARKCSNFLISLKISPCYLSHLGDAFRHAVRLEDFSGAFYNEGEDYVGFKLPQNMLHFGAYDMPVTLLASLLPHGNQLTEMNLRYWDNPMQKCGCSVIKRYPNLEVLYTEDNCGDTGIQVIAQFCKKLRKLTHGDWVTCTGLIALAEGCANLKYLKVNVKYMSNEAMECVGTHLKNLWKFHIISNRRYAKVDNPLDNGIRAMLTGCNKLESLDIILQRGELTDAGLGSIGKYGRKLKHLALDCIGESDAGLTDAGLVKLSKGCPKLRNCPFSKQAVATFKQNNHTIRFLG